ncbi:MAG: hypothetical protein NTY19_08065 [Planctomycetota bacterium]|nr:hypothetical protein [Planctomycetota bacterium]
MSLELMPPIVVPRPFPVLENREPRGGGMSEELAEEARKWVKPQPERRLPEQPQLAVSTPRVRFDLD